MAQLEQQPTTESGHIVKRQAMQWLAEIEEATNQELMESIEPKPNHFSGSKYATEISDIRITGSPEFVEAAGSLFKPLLEFENDTTRLEINLQQTEDRDTKQLTDNYALYISVSERG